MNDPVQRGLISAQALRVVPGTHARPIVGLAQNPDGVPFNCGHCDYFGDGRCHNKDKQLNGRKVEPDWCCDFFRHPGMRVIIK